MRDGQARNATGDGPGPAGDLIPGPATIAHRLTDVVLPVS